MKRILRILLLIGVFISSSIVFSGCDDDIILVTGVDLYTNEIYANINETVDLSYKVYPSNASNQKVTFWSTDENIASVDANGKVTIKTIGEASIVVRSVDGGYEDYCKIVTNIDPEEIAWESSDKLTPVSNADYSATGSMALNQVMKLKIDYLIDGEESDSVTNKNVVFTSSNTSNIQIINEKEGIIKAVNNEIVAGDKAFSDISATLKTADGELKITCRIYINEYSSLDHLYVNYKVGNMPVLNYRNGTETIYLTSGGASVDFYTYITNMSNVVKTDYEMTIESSSDSLFTVENITDNNGIKGFRLTPSEDNEGTGTLYIRTTCSDESGKAIRCNINVTIQAEINSVSASATKRKVNGYELLQNDEIFGIDLTYYDINVFEIEGAERNIYFDDLSSDVANYVTYYGNNQFKVTGVPANQTKPLSITGYIYVENVESSKRIDFEYKFYLGHPLESLVVSTTPNEGRIPSIGVSSVTLPIGGEISLFAYATTYDLSLAEHITVNIDDTAIGTSLVLIERYSDNEFRIKPNPMGSGQGIETITFVATDGVETIEYDVTIYVVASVAEIKFYQTSTAGTLSNEIASSTFTASGDEAIIYVAVEPVSSDYVIECQSGISLIGENCTIEDEVYGSTLKVVKKIKVDISNLSSGQSKTITVSSDRFLISEKLTITKQ